METISRGVPSELVDLLEIADQEKIGGFDELRSAKSVSEQGTLGYSMYFTDCLIDSLKEMYGMDEKKPHLHHPRVREAWKLKRGLLGELEVIACLESELVKPEYSEFELYNTVFIDYGGRCQLDHVVVGPPGVLHIETKNWRKTQTKRHDFTRCAYRQIKRARKIFGRYLKQVHGFKTRACRTILCAPHDTFTNLPLGVELISPLDAVAGVLEPDLRFMDSASA